MKVDITTGSASIRPNGGMEDDRNAFHVEFDPTTDSPTYLVTDAVAMIRGVDVCELEPLAGAVDPDALERLFEAGGSAGVDSIRFEYSGFDIVVESHGHIWLRRATADHRR